MAITVLHCFRAPVGGLFRHVCDLVREQAASGHSVAVVCDATTGSDLAERMLASLGSSCDGGVHRVPMPRLPGWADISALRKIRSICLQVSPDIVHGHGAKGGLYGRLLAKAVRARSIYTPHGGSLHYAPLSASGFIFLTAERLLMRRTDGLIFESRYAADLYRTKVGRASCPVEVVRNGLHEPEFEAIEVDDGGADFVFVGELRRIKGVQILLEAAALLLRERNVSVLIVGDGPDKAAFQQRARALGLDGAVKWSPAVFPAQSAFRLGHVLVLPSLHESLPYIVLEAAAARRPMLVSRVGGIPEIFGPYADHLLPPGDAEALAGAMKSALDSRDSGAGLAEKLQQRVRSEFSVERMARRIDRFYSEVLRQA